MNNDTIARIDRYLNGAMNAAEQAAFEAEVEADPSLATDLALQRDMSLFLQRKDRRAALQQELGNLGKDYFQTTATTATEPPTAKIVPIGRARLRWLTVAAAAAVLLILVWPWLTSPSLYEQYAQHPPLALIEKSADAPVDWSQTETAFNTGDCKTASAQLEEYLAQYPEDQLARLYLGICRIELDEGEAARELFSSLLTADVSIRDYAEWYLALSYLRAGEREACRAVLQDIAPASTLYARAQELLERL